MNSFQKFFRDYPIIWIVLAVLVIGLGIGLWFLKPKPAVKVKTEIQQIKPAQSKKVKPIPIPSKKSERSVKITPVSVKTPLIIGAEKINPPSLRGSEATEAISDLEIASPDQPSLALMRGALFGKDLTSFSESAGTGGQSGRPPLARQASALRPPRNDVKPQIAFVIDDLGYNKRQAELLFSIPSPLTVAILPHLAYSKYFSEEGKKHGFETILHQPLEPENKNEDPGPGVIMTDMTVEQIKATVEQNLSTVPDVVGVNNHMGSHATRDRRVMYVLGKELKKRNLFFLDSMTHSESVANRVTFALGIPTVKRDVFLDNEDVYDSIMMRIQEAAEIAKTNGKVVAIGHIRKNTLQAIKDFLPKLKADGYELTTLKKMLEDKSKNISSPLVRQTTDGSVLGRMGED